MTISRLSFCVPYTAGRDCMIVIRPRGAAYQAVCVDAATRLTIGSPVVPRAPGGGQPGVTADDVLRLIGGMYRLASVAVDIEAAELTRRTRRVSDLLRAGACGDAGVEAGCSSRLTERGPVSPNLTRPLDADGSRPSKDLGQPYAVI